VDDARGGSRDRSRGTPGYFSSRRDEAGLPGMTPRLWMKAEMPARSRKSACLPLCTCSIRPRQRPSMADHSRQKRMTKVLVEGAEDDSAMRIPPCRYQEPCGARGRGFPRAPDTTPCRGSYCLAAPARPLQACTASRAPTVACRYGRRLAYLCLFPVRVEDVAAGGARLEEARERDVDKHVLPFQVAIAVAHHADRGAAIGVAHARPGAIPAI
jgi:hypothetical protein